MISMLRLYSTNPIEINRFLTMFFGNNIDLINPLYWEKSFNNPLEMADMIAAFIDNNETFSSTNMWISIDKGVFINIKDDNYNLFIQYLFERYPY